jgi:hypothetical protein
MARGLKYIVENLKSNVNNNGMYYGIAGIEKFAEDLINYEDLAFIYQIFYLLNNPSGLAITRKNISELCDEIHLKWSNICTKECRDAYESLSESWRMVANLLFKVSRIGDKALQSRVVERVRNIIGYESEGIGLLESLAMELEGLDV